jgi:hypothetical protein
MELLLDETICGGDIFVDKELVRQVGGINEELPAKQKYELLLRIAEEAPVVLEACIEQNECVPENAGLVKLREDTTEGENEGWRTDCYVIGKYSSKLQEAGYFDAAVQSVLAEAKEQGRFEQTVAWLEQMIGHREEFYRIDDVTRPILIYKGDAVCHNVLTVFAEQFGAALERAGEHVIYFDPFQEEERESAILNYVGQRFKAIIGVQSYLFSVKMADEVHYVHEYIYGPKYNFVFDHPIWMLKHLMHQYPDFYLLVHDRNYAAFARRYFHKPAILFPPAGMQAEQFNRVERNYELTFVGTIGDYMAQAEWIHEQERPKRFLANRFLLIMRKQPNLTLEEAFARALEHQGIVVASDEEFRDRLRELCVVGYCVMHYYRYKVVETLLQGGIRLDVFGDSWSGSPLCRYPNLICHPDVTVEESLIIWQQSKLSLNVMSWHKDGFTERMAGIMLAGAVLVTDDTTYLKGRYDDGKDMLIFRLERLEELPGRVRELLVKDELRRQIAENGREKTEKHHTWQKRAEQFQKLLKDRKP